MVISSRTGAAEDDETAIEDDGQWHPDPNEQWVTVTPVPTADWFSCPKKDMKNTKCKNWKDCVYTNKRDCKTYIQCIIGSDKRKGVPIIMKCPGALQWNDDEKICDFKEKSTCYKEKNKPAVVEVEDLSTEDPNEDLGDLEATEPTEPANKPENRKPAWKSVFG